MTRAARMAWLVVLAVSGACTPVATRHTTDPAVPGKFRIGGGLDGVLFRDTPQRTTLPAVAANLDARYGVAEDVDVGVRLFTFGAGANVKWRALHRTRLSLAIVPGAYVGHTPQNTVLAKSTAVYFDVPVVLGTPMSENTALNFGPRLLTELYYPHGGGHASGALLGGFCNLDWRVGRGVHLLPELSVQGAIAGEVPVKGFVFAAGMGAMKDFF